MTASLLPSSDSKAVLSFLNASSRDASVVAEELDLLLSKLSVREYQAQEVIVRENGPGDSMYFIEEGSVEIIKESQGEDVISRLHAGEFFGELALLSGAPRAATVRAQEKVVVYVLAKADFDELIQTSPRFNGTFLNKLYARLTDSFRKLEAKNEELQETNRLRVELGSIFTNVVLVISIYTFALVLIQSDFLLQYKHAALIQYIAARTVEGITLLLIIRVVMKSSLPLRSFGLTLQGWRRAAGEALVISAIVIAGLYGLKWVSLHYGFNPVGDHAVLSLSYLDWSYLTYLVIAPLQEFIARGVMQGSIQRLLVGPHTAFWSIVITAFLFGSLHLHSSIMVSTAAVLSSFLWGWMYVRHKNLVGASLSHFLIGNFAGLLGFWQSF